MEDQQSRTEMSIPYSPGASASQAAPAHFGLLASSQRRNVRAERIIAALISLLSLALLSVAASLEPSPTGVGTHTQLVNLRPCIWLEAANMPCPTCGMTTAFAYATDGHLIASFLTQPMGFVLALIMAMAFWIGLYVAMTGSAIGQMALRLWRPSVIWTLAGFTLLSWAYKIWIVRGGI